MGNHDKLPCDGIKAELPRDKQAPLSISRFKMQWEMNREATERDRVGFEQPEGILAAGSLRSNPVMVNATPQGASCCYGST